MSAESLNALTFVMITELSQGTIDPRICRCCGYVPKIHAKKQANHARNRISISFPDRSALNKKWLVNTFKRLWNASNQPRNNVNIRVYLPRHRYATATFMKWLDEKVDINAMIPSYLSAYMGHANFSNTAYYIHLLPETLLATTSVDWERMNALIPEVEDEE